MRAFTLDAFDSPPGLRTDLPEPTAAGDEVVVRVRASSVNPVDGAIADGLLRDVAAHEFPVTLGRDYAGTVERVGDAVTGYRPGDAVFGFLPYADPVIHGGTWTELITVPEHRWLAPLPAGLDLAAAGALGLAGVTAMACLDALALSDGDTLLVVGATGGVGSLVIQLAAHAGVPVVATGRGDDVEYLRELGATMVVDRDGDITEEVRPHHDVTALIDLVSADPEAFTMRCGALEAGGRAVSTLGAAGDAPGQANIMAEPSAENLAQLARLVGDRGVRVPLQRTYALEEAGEALTAAATTRTRGKLAVAIG
jgi:NADPH:quinone reductase-like Zn-dependent oxidoreductase